jgi:peptidoglycan-associated lipoprotein
MKRNLAMLVLVVSLIVVSGCSSQKSVVREDQGEPKGDAALEQTSEARVAPEAGVEQAVVAENESADQAAARVAAMEKAAADKLASEKVTTEKTAEEKVAEEKAAAEKVALEQAGAAKAAAEAAATEKAAQAKLAAEKELYELTDVRFDFDSFDLRDEVREVLKKHAEWLTKNKDVKIVVEGHCDERGTAEYNLALGERRAKAAAKFLMDMGVDAKRIKTISYGEETPLDPGHNEEAWAKNRRAHFAASGKK